MTSCRNCNFLSCVDAGTSASACSEHQDLYEEERPMFEAYVFNERTGSEQIIEFHTSAARDEFIRRQPAHKMAH